MAKRVLAFMAHPDDAELMCVGTLIRLKKEVDCGIAIATMTSGDCGSSELGPAAIAHKRHEEAKASAKILDAEYYAGRGVDLMVKYDEPGLQRVVEIVRKAKPDIVITHPPMDYMIDHESTSRLVRMACFAAPTPNFLTYDENPAEPLGHMPHLYYTDPVELKDIYGQPVEPGFVVDISEVIDTKQQMLVCHASQRDWIREHHGHDAYVEMMKDWSGARGKLIGKTYGEGFRQHLGHPHPQNNLIAELLKMQ